MKEFIEQLEQLNATAPVDVPEPDLNDGTPDSASETVTTLRMATADELESAWHPDAHELRLFARTGLHLHDPGVLKASHKGFWPAFLHAYRSLGNYRRPWPVYMEASDTQVQFSSLNDWIDKQEAPESDPSAPARLEAWMREAVASRSVNEWSNLQGRAPEDLNVPASDGARAWLLTPTEDALSFAWGLAVAAVNAGRRRGLLEEVESLRARLADLVRVEEEDSEAAHEPDRLKHQTGGAFTDTIDFGSLSRLIDEAPHAAPSDTVRMERVRGILTDLESIPDELYADQWLREPQRTVETALETLHAQVDRFTRLSRAIQIGRLEVENRYRPDVHDAVFDAYSYQAIPTSERKAFPPVPVHLSLRGDDDPEPVLVALREPGMLRVLLTSMDVFNDRAEHHPVTDAARRMVADADTFVQQTSVSHVDFLLEGMTLAARAQGNALMSVALGSATDPTSAPAYLAAAVLSESRTFPCFRFDPEHGSEWADWMDIRANEGFDQDWMAHAADGDGQKDAPGPFLLTPADLLFLDGRFAEQFHLLDPRIDSDELVEAGEWTRLASAERNGRIPFVWLSTPDGLLARAVASPMVMRAVLLSARRWQLLREWAGVNSSLVEREIDARHTAMEAERDAAIDAARADFEARMEENTETLARAIVENIAASLLDGSGTLTLGDASGRTALAAQAVRRSAPSSASPEASVSETEDAEASVSEEQPDPEPEAPVLVLDEAYIDTPLCTSCNECTDRNAQIFAYNENKQAFIKDASAGPFRDIVMAAEKCPVRIIHPGKPGDPDEQDLDEWVERAKPFQ